MAVYCALSDHPNLRDSNCWWLPSMDRAPVVVYVWFVHVTPMIRASPSSVISCVNSVFVFLANVELFVPNFREFSFSFRSVVMVVSTNATPDTFVFLVRFNNFFFVFELVSVLILFWNDGMIDWLIDICLNTELEWWSPFQQVLISICTFCMGVFFCCILTKNQMFYKKTPMKIQKHKC